MHNGELQEYLYFSKTQQLTSTLHIPFDANQPLPFSAPLRSGDWWCHVLSSVPIDAVRNLMLHNLRCKPPVTAHRRR